MSTALTIIADRYELVSVLGEGGMGVVWRARDTRLGRAVALKLLTPAAVGSEVARARLLREARAAAALDHDGIVHVYDVGETGDGGAYLVMELIRGNSLRDELEKRSLSRIRKAEVIVSAARALAFAHAAGIVHRDIKPDNIMIRENGRVTVVDFGVAKPVNTELLVGGDTVLAGSVSSKVLTADGQLVGTPAYLAPEQARGAEVSPATDQFALAVTAFEAFSGRLPWSGEGILDLVASLLRDDSPPVSECADLPRAFDEVFARALAKRTADRYPSMTAFADAFEEASVQLVASSPLAASIAPGRGPSSSTTSGASEIEVRPAPDTAKSSDRISRESESTRSFGLVGAMGAVVALVAVGLGIRSFGSSGENASAAADAAGNVAPATATSDAIACPPFEVIGSEEVWLGAPAAALACERIQIARGGQDSKTMVPADLLGASRDIVRTQGDDVIDDKPSRDRALTAAEQRGVRWLQGTVQKTATEYVVRIRMRGPGIPQEPPSEGRSVELFEAVRDALRPIIARLPKSQEELVSLREWFDVDSVDEALDLHDIRVATLIEDPISLKAACTAIEKRDTLNVRARYLAKTTCVRELRFGKVEGAPPPVQKSPPGALITSVLAHGALGGAAGVRERAALLERAFEESRVPEGQARFAAAAAELYNLVGDSNARAIARRSVYASPKAYDWRTSSWHRVLFTSNGENGLAGALRSWQPWEPAAQSVRVPRNDVADSSVTEMHLWRAYMLGQRGYFAGAYGADLIDRGRLESALVVAEQTKDDLLRVEILEAQGNYGAAYAQIPKMIAALPATDEKAALAFRLTLVGARVAFILERPADFVEDVVKRYVEAEPHHIVDGVVPYVSLIASCCFAPKPVGRRCIDRVKQLRSTGQLPTIFDSSDAIVEGADHFVSGDDAGAARAWRKLLRSPAWIQDPAHHAMAMAFDRSGMPELGDEVDAPMLGRVDLPRIADPAWVRAAKRAYKKGDYPRARKYAAAVVDRWRLTDEDIPAVREMKDLLAKLPK